MTSKATWSIWLQFLQNRFAEMQKIELVNIQPYPFFSQKRAALWQIFFKTYCAFHASYFNESNEWNCLVGPKFYWEKSIKNYQMVCYRFGVKIEIAHFKTQYRRSISEFTQRASIKECFQRLSGHTRFLLNLWNQWAGEFFKQITLEIPWMDLLYN